MRDKLIEMLSQYFDIGDSYAYNLTRHKSAFAIGTMSLEDFEEFDDDTVADIADYLLANGVIVPPCKVGDTVYFPMESDGECESYVDVGTVFAIGIDEGHTMWISVRYESGLKYYHTSDDFGKTILLTREDAERALRERSGNNE